ncbi:MAG: four helix bundle protein [Bacteroidetes bacterium]|nr:four helix bundle protein [Bacteroidota bacterium]
MYMQNNLNTLRIYTQSLQLSNRVWDTYTKLSKENKSIIGNQIVRSTDSIGANIAEAYGRFHIKDSIKFLYYSRGSLYETMHWISLMEERDLISKSTHEDFMIQIQDLGIRLNNFITSRKAKL